MLLNFSPLSLTPCGLDYKQITTLNDASRVISEWHDNLEHHSRVVNWSLRSVIYTHL